MGNGPSRCGFGRQTIHLDMTDIPYYDNCPWSRESEEERPFRHGPQGSMPAFGHHMSCPPSCYGPSRRQRREAERFAREFERGSGRDRDSEDGWRELEAFVGLFGNGPGHEPQREQDNRGSAAPGSTRRSAAPGSVGGSAAPGSAGGSAALGSARGSAAPVSSRRSAAPETVRGSLAPESEGRAPTADDVREYRRAPSRRSCRAPMSSRRRHRGHRTRGSDVSGSNFCGPHFDRTNPHMYLAHEWGNPMD